MHRNELTDIEIQNLRQKGLLGEEEFAYKAGDLVIAENASTGSRRVLGQTSAVLLESSRQILKG